MEKAWYRQLKPEAQTLLEEAYRHLSAGYDPKTHIVTVQEGDMCFQDIRASMYYALCVLEMSIPDADADAVAQAIVETVLDLQMVDKDEVYHGAFRRYGDALPPQGTLDDRFVSPTARYQADVAWGKITAHMASFMQKDPVLCERAEVLEREMHAALLESLPVAWDAYEPNLREFIGMTLAMLLEHFEERFPEALVQRMELAMDRLLVGAVRRRKTNLTPLNTNIRIMYIFLLAWFGQRSQDSYWTEEALKDARLLLEDYHEFHAVAEYNSPTYCGVDLSTLGFWRKYTDLPALHEIADALEEGIWRDMAAFYNPAMRNFCGPYSRAYEMDMSIHTCFYDLLYLGLGEERFPYHPYSIESAINPLTVLGDIRIPAGVQKQFLTEGRERNVQRRFRELSERGDPRKEQAVCTATAFISKDLMLGAMSGSRNTSHQLHPFVAFWRGAAGLGTIKLLRCLPDGRMMHMHTVLFCGRVHDRHMSMQVDCACPRDVDVFFEIEYPGLDPSMIESDTWHLPDLQVNIQTAPEEAFVQVLSDHVLRVCYPYRKAKPQTQKMQFTMDFQEAGQELPDESESRE